MVSTIFLEEIFAFSFSIIFSQKIGENIVVFSQMITI
jgi:hypothetical protein